MLMLALAGGMGTEGVAGIERGFAAWFLWISNYGFVRRFHPGLTSCAPAVSWQCTGLAIVVMMEFCA